MPLTFIKSDCGKDMLKHKGFLFYFDKNGFEGKQIWKCQEYYRNKCNARVHTKNGEILKDNIGEHHHTTNPADCKKKEILNEIKSTAKTTTTTSQLLVSNAIAQANTAVAARLPPIHSMKRTAQRARNKAENVTATPSSLESLIISQEFREIPAKDGPGTELFLQYDSADLSPNARHRIIIFTTDRNLDILDQAQHWFGDGTFRLTPRFFSQIYTIHALHLTKVLPLVYVLMTSKSEESYKEMFLRLKSLKPTLNPTTMMTDFELAAINAFHHVFPAAQQRGCFFHHQQCLVRKMQDLKILDKYNNDEIFHIKVNMLPALAFVPEDNVTAAFENLIDDARFDDPDLFELIGYYSDVYVLGVGARGRRRPPLYEPKLWNCYTAVIEKIPKTNNDLEGWHNRFGSCILGSHPTIWKFIEAIKRDEQTTFVDNVQSQVGTSAKRSRKTYRNYAEKLHDLVNAYDPDSNIIDYLESIAHNI